MTINISFLFNKEEHKLTSTHASFKITINHAPAVEAGFHTVRRSVKAFSHLSGHELPEARRERECGDQQGDECGIHQAPDRKRGTAGSLMGVPVTLYVHTSFLTGEDGKTINSSL